MTTLTDFLLARIGEDEAAARGGKRDYQPSTPHWGYCEMVWADNSDPSWTPPCTCDMAARVLAECAAKRRIVEAFIEEVPDGKLEFWEDEGRGEALAFALRALASAYADHPDYREEWR